MNYPRSRTLDAGALRSLSSVHAPIHIPRHRMGKLAFRRRIRAATREEVQISDERLRRVEWTFCLQAGSL